MNWLPLANPRKLLSLKAFGTAFRRKCLRQEGRRRSYKVLGEKVF
ncbi:hypothetical protein [Okeania sp. KiyG1]|nr:hypothetical protein [Okeania sp. KiyG1]